MKKSIKLLALPVVIASLAAAGAVGGTFAYFTNAQKSSVSVKSAKVAFELEASDLHVFSLDIEQQNGLFQNGGTAELDGTAVRLVNVTPGDKVVFNAKVVNKSTVKTQYLFYTSFANEVKGEQEGAKFLSQGGLEIKATDINDPDVAVPTEVQLLDAEQNPDNNEFQVTIEMPVDRGNEFQDASADIILGVSAIQANGPRLVASYQDIREQLNSGETEIMLAGDLTLQPDETIHLGTGVTLDCGGHRISALDRNYNLFYVDGADVTIANANIVTDAALGIALDGHGVTLKNSTITANPEDSYYFFYNRGLGAIADDIVIENTTIDGFWATIYGDAACIFTTDADVIIKNSEINSEAYTLNTGSPAGNLLVENSVIRGWTSYAGYQSVMVKDSTFKATNHGSAKYNFIRAYNDSTFENCKFVNDGPDGIVFEVVNNAKATFKLCLYAADGETFVAMNAEDRASYAFVTLNNSGYESVTDGTSVFIDDVELTAGDFQ